MTLMEQGHAEGDGKGLDLHLLKAYIPRRVHNDSGKLIRYTELMNSLVSDTSPQSLVLVFRQTTSTQ